MFTSETFLLGFALAVDAAVVSFALGLLSSEGGRKEKLLRGTIVASTFGLYQFLMLWLGSYGGFVLSFSSMGHLFPLIVSAVFLFIGLKFIFESFDADKKDLEWGILPLLVLGLMTSIDALASGVSLGILPKTYLIAMDIGIITFVLCALFFSLAQFFKNIPDRWLLRLAGLIFLGLGGNIVWENVLKGAL